MFRFRISKEEAIAHAKYACKYWLPAVPMAPVLLYGLYKWDCADAERQTAFRDKSALYGLPAERRPDRPRWPGIQD